MFSRDISRFVFRPSIRRDMGQVSLSAAMLEVLRVLDGKRDAQTVSRSLQMSMSALREVLGELHRLGLIEQVEAPRAMLDRRFLKDLEGHLAHIMGPMAGVLIRDEIAQMGEKPGAFPKDRTGELIDRLASKISFEAKRNAFLQAVRGL